MSDDIRGRTAIVPEHGVSFAEALRVWTRVAALSFGGPAGQIAVMHRIVVDEKRWIGETRFLHALSYCTLLPGPEAQQLAIYIGWLMHGTRGGIAAGTLFVLPGVLCIMVLSYIYAGLGHVGAVAALFFGLKASRARGGGPGSYPYWRPGAEQPCDTGHRRGCVRRDPLPSRRSLTFRHERRFDEASNCSIGLGCRRAAAQDVHDATGLGIADPQLEPVQS